MADRAIGIIGGSGVYDLDGLSNVEEIAVDTPFGPPSDKFITGTLAGSRLVFLSRHCRGHRIPPHQINYRANIYGMKVLGVEWLFSVSAVGSMREDIPPGDMVVVDQFIDRTRGRVSTFFDDGIAAHVGFGDPISPVLSDILHKAAVETLAGTEVAVHRGGTYLVINGPQFSTRAESNLYRQWGISVIGMTNMPEAKLAREAEISYATLALATDYDCWHEDEADVTVESVIAVVKKNSERARKVLARAVAMVPMQHECVAANALAGAIMTDAAVIPAETKQRLAPIIGKYVS